MFLLFFIVILPCIVLVVVSTSAPASFAIRGDSVSWNKLGVKLMHNLARYEN